MASPLTLPLINGVRHNASNVEIKVANLIIIGVKSVNYSRKRTRAQVRGFHPDPLAQTLGENEYTADLEMFFAEYMLLQNTLLQLNGGKGYGDITFDVLCTYGANGFDTVTDTIRGCNLDSVETGLAQGPDAITRKIDLSPLKIFYNGVDDLAVPLLGQPA